MAAATYALYSPAHRTYRLDSLLDATYDRRYVRKHGWKYYYLYTAIIKAGFRTDARWIRLSSSDLERTLGRITNAEKQQAAYLHIRRELAAWNIIRCHTQQVNPGERRAWYRILEEVAQHGFVPAMVTVPGAVQKMLPTRRYAGLHGRLQRSFNRLTIDYSAALGIARHAYQTQAPLAPKRSKKSRLRRERSVDAQVYAHWLALIETLRTGETYFHVSSKTGRVINSFTNLPKILRGTVRLAGHTLHEVDVSACQPLLLTKLVQEYCVRSGTSPGPDLARWQDLCERGEIYPFLYACFLSRGVELDSMRQAGMLSGTCTRAFKVDLFAQIVFSKERKIAARQAFHELFPTVSSAISAGKQPDHRQLAIRLQRLESDLLIQTVAARLFEQRHRDFLTLHDAIYCPAGLAAEVVTEIRHAFQEIGLQPQVKITPPLH